VKNFVFIFFLTIGSICINAQNHECKFCGTWRWEKNDEHHDFSIELSLKDGLLLGRHCYVLNSGNKMDCSNGGKEFSIKIELPKNDTVTLKVKSFYSGEVGIAHLEIKEGKLFWKLVKAPKGEYYFPKQAVLIRSK
jgi:hypothetical protein